MVVANLPLKNKKWVLSFGRTEILRFQFFVVGYPLVGGIQCLTSWYDEMIVTFLSWDVWFKCATYCWCTFFLNYFVVENSSNKNTENGRMVLWFQRIEAFTKTGGKVLHFLKVPTVTTRLKCLLLKNKPGRFEGNVLFSSRGYVKFRRCSFKEVFRIWKIIFGWEWGEFVFALLWFNEVQIWPDKHPTLIPWVFRIKMLVQDTHHISTTSLGVKQIPSVKTGTFLWVVMSFSHFFWASHSKHPGRV